MDTGGESIPMGSGARAAAAVMTVPVRSPLPSSVRCPATAASSGTTSGELVGFRGDGVLTDDNPLAVPERGKQPDLPAAGVHLGPGRSWVYRPDGGPQGLALPELVCDYGLSV